MTAPDVAAPAVDAAELLSDSPKMIRETLCVAQSAIGLHSDSNRRREHMDRLQRLIDECDRHRPLGADGKHVIGNEL